MKCPKCGSEKTVKHGFKTLLGKRVQLYQCANGHIFHDGQKQEA